MTLTPPGYRTFREIAAELARKCHGRSWRTHYLDYLGRVVRDFFLNRFTDKDGKSRVFHLDISGRVDKKSITRELIWRVMGDANKPSSLRYIPEHSHPPWKEIAAVRVDEYTSSFRESYLERLCLLEADAREWVENRRRKDDPISKRIREVLQAGAKKQNQNRNRGHSQIANLLARKDTDVKFASYGYESIRQIFGGTFPPAVERGYEGLERWVEENQED